MPATPQTFPARHAPFLAPLFLTLLAASACDPGDVSDLLSRRLHPPTGGGTSDGGTISNPCAAILCAANTHCEVNAVQCIKAPCPPAATCVANTPTISCGGIAGIACPGAGKCVDNPADTCDPAKGGADCGGICSCVQNVACVKGATFDSSTKVCACVVPTPPPPTCGPVCLIFCENGNVLDANGCPTCTCNPPPTDNPCATVRCAADTHCESTAVQCIKAPCPPVATCVPNAPVVRCGGIAGLACPGSGKCADDPTDSCDPAKGGADCGGICGCVQNVACVKGATFDSSPKVCACVAAPTTSVCPVEKCTGPAPKSANYLCPDGKTTAGPACVVDASGACGWTITTCP